MYTFICKYNAQRAATLAACNDAANGSCPLSVDEVRDRGSPNREWQNTSQGLLVTHREVPLACKVKALVLRVLRISCPYTLLHGKSVLSFSLEKVSCNILTTFAMY